MKEKKGGDKMPLMPVCKECGKFFATVDENKFGGVL
jgi:hypothetical protein